MIVHKCCVCGKTIYEGKEGFFRVKANNDYIYYCRKCYANKRWKELKSENKHGEWLKTLYSIARLIRELPKEAKEEAKKHFLEDVPSELEEKILKIIGD